MKNICKNCRLNISDDKLVAHGDGLCEYCRSFPKLCTRKTLGLMNALTKEPVEENINIKCKDIADISEGFMDNRQRYASQVANTLNKMNILCTPLLRTSLMFDENALSDLIYNGFSESDRLVFLSFLTYLNILKKPHKVQYNLFARESFTTSGRNTNRSDISAALTVVNQRYRIAIEHKIRHSLSRSQLVAYDNLDKHLDWLILVSSSQKDKSLLETFFSTKRNTKNWIFVTHIDLLRFFIQADVIKKMVGYGILIRWLADLAFQFYVPNNNYPNQIIQTSSDILFYMIRSNYAEQTSFR